LLTLQKYQVSIETATFQLFLRGRYTSLSL